MSEMVERVANALIRCEDSGDVLVSAIAAIAAMREPTAEMIERLGKVLYDHHGDREDKYYAAEWEPSVRAFIEAWIDEALK